jgi:hypothetical protein
MTHSGRLALANFTNPESLLCRDCRPWRQDGTQRKKVRFTQERKVARFRGLPPMIRLAPYLECWNPEPKNTYTFTYSDPRAKLPFRTTLKELPCTLA